MNDKVANAKKKDSEGVRRYVLPLVFVSLLPVFWFYFCSNFKFVESFPNWAKYSEAVDSMSALILFLLLIFYFSFTIGYTIWALKNHWSKSIDKFFNQLSKPTVGLVIVLIIVVIAEYKRFFVGCESDFVKLFLHNFYVSLIPTYIIIYLIVVANHIYRKKIKKM